MLGEMWIETGNSQLEKLWWRRGEVSTHGGGEETQGPCGYVTLGTWQNKSPRVIRQVAPQVLGVYKCEELAVLPPPLGTLLNWQYGPSLLFSSFLH
ncbi:hypothetical protein Tco_1042801 [Tanacetum coccineum]|uniref:Uncharacterized protein n=1 Tax=Tanacetum coccineum TaxID=301880 RepID=A0ABQ5GLI7_9ASTR